MSVAHRRPGFWPLGRVANAERGSRMVGLPTDETLIVYVAGKTRWGKTELAKNAFLHMVHVERHGALFVDPAADAVVRLKSFLTAPEVLGRVTELGLHTDRQPGWNPLSMAGLGRDAVAGKVNAFGNAIAAVQGWSTKANSRAYNLAVQAAQALIELGLLLPEDLQPTIFQIPRLLTDDAWREEVLKFLPEGLQGFWRNEFTGIAREAVPPVTHLIHTMRLSDALTALLGRSESTFDARRAMDQGRIVLLCPGTGSHEGRVLANLLVYDVVRALFGRADIPPEERLPFWLFLDELQTYDGAISGRITDLLEGTCKFGGRTFALNQEPERLAADTLLSLLANLSQLITTAVSPDSAKALMKGRSGAPAPETIAGLPKYQYVVDAWMGRRYGRPAPFQVEGVPTDQLWAAHHHPERVEVLDRMIDRQTKRRTAAQVREHLNTLEERILHALRNRGRRTSRGRASSDDRGGSSGHVLPLRPPSPSDGPAADDVDEAPDSGLKEESDD